MHSGARTRTSVKPAITRRFPAVCRRDVERLGPNDKAGTTWVVLRRLAGRYHHGPGSNAGPVGITWAFQMPGGTMISKILLLEVSLYRLTRNTFPFSVIGISCPTASGASVTTSFPTGAGQFVVGMNVDLPP